MVVVEEFTVLPPEFSRIELFEEVLIQPIQLPLIKTEVVSEASVPVSSEIWLRGTRSGRVFRDPDGAWVIHVPRSEIVRLDGPRENQDHLQVRIRGDQTGEEYEFLIGLSADLWLRPIGDNFPSLPLELEWLDLKDRIGFRLAGLDNAGYLPTFTLISKSRDEAW
jgi:hypothetical protein